MPSRPFEFRTEEEVRRAVDLWLEQRHPQYDSTFGLLLLTPPTVERWRARLGPPATSVGYHDPVGSSLYALALLFAEREREAVHRIVSRVLEAQVLERNSPLFGEFKLVYEASGDDILDSNATFFCCLPLVCIEREYASLVDPDLLKRIRAALVLASRTVHANEFKLGVYYTNRSLANLAVWFGVADMLQDRTFAETVIDRFNYFYDLNMRRGIPERLSQGYYRVDIVALGMIQRYAPDAAVRNRAREMMAVLAQELLFFEDRQPLPARRTYNAQTGVALKWSVLDWLLGALPDLSGAPVNVAAVKDGGDDVHRRPIDAAGWLPLADLYLRGVLRPELFTLPPGRQMRGRFVDESGYTSYFHEDFTLGTFDAWPPLTIRDAVKQYPDDMPVGFAGASGDLVYFGAYSIDAKGGLHTHPGTGTVLLSSEEAVTTVKQSQRPLYAGELGALVDSSGALLPTVTYLTAQEANLCCVQVNVSGGVRCLVREYGWRLFGPLCRARLFDQNGRELFGDGEADAQWLFLVTRDYFAAIHPLTRYAAVSSPKGFGHTPASQNIRYVVSENSVSLFAPVFASASASLMLGDNWPAGAVFLLDSARRSPFEEFRRRTVEQAEVLDDWRLDGYLIRRGIRDGEHSAGLRLPGAELRLVVDYRTGAVSRTFNGRPISPPHALSRLRVGVGPWGGDSR